MSKNNPRPKTPVNPEPDWECYRIDEIFDSPGIRREKLEYFMDAFIDWRSGKTPDKLPKKPAAQDT